MSLRRVITVYNERLNLIYVGPQANALTQVFPPLSVRFSSAIHGSNRSNRGHFEPITSHTSSAVNLTVVQDSVKKPKLHIEEIEMSSSQLLAINEVHHSVSVSICHLLVVSPSLSLHLFFRHSLSLSCSFPPIYFHTHTHRLTSW